MELAPPTTRRELLAEFLRHYRERTAPDAVGLPADGLRRTPGLRREEVAQLAGVGLSWYTWLEQGRDITPSASVLDALARVYDLTASERAHLFHLAGVAVPVAERPYPTAAPQELRDFVNALGPTPAYLLGPRTDVLIWNDGAAAMIGQPSCAPDGVPNLLWWMFTEADRGGDATARLVLARFRAEHARRYDDPAFRVLIEALLDVSPAFRELWRRHEVKEGQLGTKRVEHPRFGRLTLHHLQSIPTSYPDLRLTQFTPADAATRIALSEALGAQRA